MADPIHYNQPLTSVSDTFEESIIYPDPSYDDYFSKSSAQSYWPLIDISEKEDFYMITADLPGIEKKDIKISIDQYNNIIIQGKKGAEIKKENNVYLCFERYKGTFYRKISLLKPVDTQRIKAKYQDGVLEIRAPKIEESIAKEINIED